MFILNPNNASAAVLLGILSGVGEFLSIPGSGIFLGFLLGFAASYFQLRFLCEKCKEGKK